MRALASSAIRQAMDALRCEVTLTRKDATRATARGFARLGADLLDRANRLEQLAATLADVLEDRGQPGDRAA